MAKVFISYSHLEPDNSLAKKFCQELIKAGHEVFRASESIELGASWTKKIDEALESSDYFLLLLSARSLESDMVTEEVRRAKKLRETRASKKPSILPIRVELPLGQDINYDLASYLNRIQQRLWNGEKDTSPVLSELLGIIDKGEQPEERPDSTDKIVVRDTDKPLPNAPLEAPAGNVSLQSRFYIKRKADEEFINAILQPGALLRIKAPRQFGKTSLLSRVISCARQNAHDVVLMSLQQFDESTLTSLDLLLKHFCAFTSRQLDLPILINEFWDNEYLGLKEKCTGYFEQHLLEKIKKPFVLAIDEADRLFGYEPSSDFYGMIRVWYEKATNSDIWNRMKIVIVYSTEANLSLSGNQSPLNVGIDRRLEQFTKREVRNLVALHNLAWGDNDIDDLMALIGGYPYLVRKALYSIAVDKVPLEIFLKEAPTDNGPYGDHLMRHLYVLKQQPELEAELRFILKKNRGTSNKSLAFHRLVAGGLVKGEQSSARLSLNLYKKYFNTGF